MKSRGGGVVLFPTFGTKKPHNLLIVRLFCFVGKQFDNKNLLKVKSFIYVNLYLLEKGDSSHWPDILPTVQSKAWQFFWYLDMSKRVHLFLLIHFPLRFREECWRNSLICHQNFNPKSSKILMMNEMWKLKEDQLKFLTTRVYNSLLRPDTLNHKIYDETCCNSGH